MPERSEHSSTVIVSSSASAAEARAEVRRLFPLLGGPETFVEEAAVCVSELVENVARHGGRFGRVRVSIDLATGLAELVAEDDGPGFGAVPEVGAARGLGQGLAAVARLMDSLEISVAAEGWRGARVCARRWPHSEPSLPRVVTLCRPHPQERNSGDVVLAQRAGSRLRLAVIDGRGHGDAAAQAATTAAAALGVVQGEALGAAVARAHQVSARTRGSAFAALELDASRRTLDATGFGNVRAAVLSGERPSTLAFVGAVLGHGLPGRADLLPRVDAQPWPSSGALIAFTDGVSRAALAEVTLAAVKADRFGAAWALFRRHAQARDDATLLVAS